MTDADPRPEPAFSASGAPHVTGAPDVPGPTGVDPVTAPLTYPGTPPRRSAVVVTDEAVLVLRPLADAPLGKWLLRADPEALPTPAGPTEAVATSVAHPAVTSTESDRPLGYPGAHHPDPGRSGPQDSESEPDPGGPGYSGPSFVESRQLDPDRPDSGRPASRYSGPDLGSPSHGELSQAGLSHPEVDHSGLGRSSTRRPGPGGRELRHPGTDQPQTPRRDASAAVSESGSDLREVSLDRYLLAVGRSPAASLTPVLAVGSNASPAQLRRKLTNAGLPTLVPITAVRVRGLAVGVSAHVSRPGYLPATPVPSADAVSDLWVLWLDEAALAAVDATEPNYERVLLPDRCPVRLPAGQPIPACWVYLSRHGYLLNQAGEPRRLTDQPTLISGLLAEIPALPPLAGTSPQEWIERTRDVAVRDAVREVFGSMGLVRRVEEL